MKIALVKALMMPLGFVLGALIALPIALQMADAPQPSLAEEPNLGRPHAAGSVPALMERHDCWTGEAPAGVGIPGHVVVTQDGASAPTYGGARMVGLALEQLFNGEDAGLTVHGFCR